MRMETVLECLLWTVGNSGKACCGSGGTIASFALGYIEVMF